MSAYYYGAQHHQPGFSSAHPSSSHGHHGGRTRRGPRLSNSQNSHRQFRGVRSMRELAESPPVSTFRVKFEAGRSFDLEDDWEFCPDLMTEDDRQTLYSSSSEGSMSSGSPEASPLQQQIQPTPNLTPSFTLQSAATNPYHPNTGYQSSSSNAMKLHQPSALRTRNAIPIVNPNTGMRLPSPPSSISPAMMQQQTYARRW